MIVSAQKILHAPRNGSKVVGMHDIEVVGMHLEVPEKNI